MKLLINLIEQGSALNHCTTGKIHYLTNLKLGENSHE